MNDPTQIRLAVSEAYARMVQPGGNGCCGTIPKGVLAKAAGYRNEELAAIPSDAVTHSFGCGNPLAFSAVREGDVVLDLGSGAGIDVVLAAGKVGPAGRVIGVDMTDEMIAKARQSIARAGLTNAEIRKGLIENLPVESSSVDWVISNCVINLSPEKARVFAEIARVLKPGGTMLVSDVLVEGLNEELREDFRLYSCCVAGAIDENEYRDGLTRAGLVDIEIRKENLIDVDQLLGLIDAGEKACDGGADLAEVTAAMGLGHVWTAQIKARRQ